MTRRVISGFPALVASLPILFFFFALIKLKLKGYVAASWTVVIALAVALLFYKMPVDHALASVVYGFFYGLWPIAWIIIAAVFVYKISVKTGQFDIIRSSILSVTPDQRLQMLIVGFCFGAFLEGAAGFGAPVAITAALLVGLGFNPLYAAGLCLIVNTAPVAFGAMGIPILVAGQVTGLDSFEIGQMVGRQLPFLTIIVLFWIMAIMDGWRGVKETWPAVMVSGGSFAIAPVSQLQLYRAGTAGHYLFAGLSGVSDAVPQTLAAGAHLPLRRYGRVAGRSDAGPHPLYEGANCSRVVAVPVPDRHGHSLERTAVQSAVCPRRRAV
ncbi:L-lactate permease [Salmonella enterica subsp. arizonae]|uniref:L-lactate permease n=1 Tax=Salmonella enterica subsp. arizonae TaxID=59203 RepID=A0A379T4B6_SALER|nr:L-lactate permease [Salmonella enterica subsp. arizonae]